MLHIDSVTKRYDGVMALDQVSLNVARGEFFGLLPVSFMPEFMQQIARFTLTYWAIEAFSQVLWAGKSFVQILPSLGILSGITVGVVAGVPASHCLGWIGRRTLPSPAGRDACLPRGKPDLSPFNLNSAEELTTDDH